MDFNVDIKTAGYLLGQLLGVCAVVAMVLKFGMKSYFEKSSALDSERQKAISDAVEKLNKVVDEIFKDNKDVRLKIVEVEKSIIELRVKVAENFDRRAGYAEEQRHFVEDTNKRLSAIEQSMIELKTEVGMLVSNPRKSKK